MRAPRYGWHMVKNSFEPEVFEQWACLLARRMSSLDFTPAGIAQGLTYRGLLTREGRPFRGRDIGELLGGDDVLLWWRWKRQEEQRQLVARERLMQAFPLPRRCVHGR